MNYVLEVCVDSLESAIAAEKGGASRLELCDNLVIGGTTPSPAFYRQVREIVSIPIHLLVRPRFGDFLYSEAEVQRMAEEMIALQQVGANTFVIGALDKDGNLAKKELSEMMKAVPEAGFVLHRAFDMTRNAERALEDAITLGFSGILTSGQEGDALKGAENIAGYCRQASGRIEIMAGAGVSSRTIAEIRKKTGAKTFHMSGKIRIPSEMKYRNPRVFMGMEGMSEYEKYLTSEAEIRLARVELERSWNDSVCIKTHCHDHDAD